MVKIIGHSLKMKREKNQVKDQMAEMDGNSNKHSTH